MCACNAVCFGHVLIYHPAFTCLLSLVSLGLSVRLLSRPLSIYIFSRRRRRSVQYRLLPSVDCFSVFGFLSLSLQYHTRTEYLDGYPGGPCLH